MNHELIKVCGMRDADNIRAVEALGVNWLGLIFWPRSSRYVAAPPAYLPTKAKRVGVFVDADINDIRRTAETYSLDIIQLHGSETPEFVSQLRSSCGDSIAIIKAFNIATSADLEQTKCYEDIIDYFLFDTKGKSVGGNGEKFDWSVLADYDGKTPFLLSGGIGPDDAERVKTFSHPRCIGIDLNSRFESAPGLKDSILIKQFLDSLDN